METGVLGEFEDAHALIHAVRELRRAVRELGMTYRPLETTIIDMFQQMVDASDDATVKLAVVELTVEPSAGPAVMVTVGRIESTMKLRVRVGPTPTASRA